MTNTIDFLCLRYDWSIISRVAEDHLLDRVIGVQMGCEHVDVFSSLLMRNMRHILKKILALLGDMDLIRYITNTSSSNYAHSVQSLLT